MDEPDYDQWLHRGDPEMGRLLLDPLSASERVRRAAAVLHACIEQSERVAEVDQVLEIARDATRWWEGHRAFDAVRRLTLEAERRHATGRYVSLLFVAEITAKTAYNASEPLDPFDDDSPWWLVPNARHFALTLGDARIRRRLWQVLYGEECEGAG
jgi:hypothetical protein